MAKQPGADTFAHCFMRSVGVNVRTRVTKQFRLVPQSHRSVHDTVISEFTKAAEINEVGCLYFIDQGDESSFTKAGITSSGRLAKRLSEHQTGNPRKLRYVTLCLFYSREIACEVEKELKRRHHAQKLGGGQEWFNVPRKDLKKSVVKIAHDLAHHQVRANASKTPFARRELSKYFYGLLVFDITGRETFEQDDQLEIEATQQVDETPDTEHPVAEPMPQAPQVALLVPSAIDQSPKKQNWWRSLLSRGVLR